MNVLTRFGPPSPNGQKKWEEADIIFALVSC
jgi:hypothetical protein